jgi:hypothetical protein
MGRSRSDRGPQRSYWSIEGDELVQRSPDANINIYVGERVEDDRSASKLAVKAEAIWRTKPISSTMPC